MRHAQVRTVPDPTAAAAERIADALRDAVAERGRATLVLAGGSTPLPAYEALAERDDVPWASVWVLFGDERHVAPDDARRNERAARAALLDRVALPDDQILAWPWGKGVSAAEAAAALDRRVRDALGGWPTFDVVVLGVGGDGHTASLFPGTGAAFEPGPTLAVHPDDQPEARLSMSLDTLANARRVIVLATGEGKRDALERALALGDELDPPAPGTPRDPRLDALPAAGIAARGSVELITDLELAPA